MRAPPFPVPPAVIRAALGLRRRIFNLADLVLPPEAARTVGLRGGDAAHEAGGCAREHWTGRRPRRTPPRSGRGRSRAWARARRDAPRAEGRCGLAPGAAGPPRPGASVQAWRPLRSGHPRSVASWVAYQAAPANARAHEQLDVQLRHGAEPSGHRRAFGNSLWDHFAAYPDEGARFGNAMRELTAIDLAALVRAYPWPSEGVVCDVAGRIGTLLAAILERRTAARGILIESPEVLAEAEGFLRSRGVAERVERRPGDLFGELEARADVHVLKWILRDWSDDACRDMLRRVRATMPAGARVVAIDQHMDPDRPHSATSMVDLLMLAECEDGRERSPDQVHGLMRDAGLDPGPVRHAGLQMLVEGIAR